MTPPTSNKDGTGRNPGPGASPFDRIIEWSLANRLFVLCAAALVSALGIGSLSRIPIDAIPDLSENQVIVTTDWEGHSPTEVEDHVTYPLASHFLGLSGVKDVRGSSHFGFSVLTLVFEETIDPYFARNRILERLQSLPDQFPNDARPRLGPDANGLGWIYQYHLTVDPKVAPEGGYDLGQLRALQDWLLRHELGAIDGVAEVAGIGGFQREYQIELSSFKLRHHGVSAQQAADAIRDSNLSVGGRIVQESGREFLVRGDALLRRGQAVKQLESVVVTERDNTPIYLKELGTITEGGAFRRGVLDVGGREAIGGIVVMRSGEDARAVTRRIEAKLNQLREILPPGIGIRAFYDRSKLIDQTVSTLIVALWKEIAIVALVHILFFWHFRSILVVTLPIPVAILGALLMMRLCGITANVMSLGGLAVAIGVLVDAGIVMAENVLRLSAAQSAAAGRCLTSVERLLVTSEACRMVGRPLGFASLVIIVAFLPVFGLTGAEGQLFHPLAFTKTFAMAISTAFTLTATPVLCAWLASESFQRRKTNPIIRFANRIYCPFLNAVLSFKYPFIVTASFLLVLSACLALGIPSPLRKALEARGWSRVATLFQGCGEEFMPTLEENGLVLMPVFAPGVAINEVQRVMAWQDRVIAKNPEVRSVVGKLGRADTATDPAPIGMIETTIQLHPRFIPTNLSLGPFSIPWTVKNPVWREGMTRERLVYELTRALNLVTGAVPGFLQPIENRILMLNTGIRGEIGVKVFGDEAAVVQEVADQILRAVRDLPGVSGLAPSRQLGQPHVEVDVDRTAIGKHGLTPADVLSAVELGLGGKVVTTAIEGRERVPVLVRLAASERADIGRLGDLLVTTPAGAAIPLSMLATVRRTIGPAVIESENGRLRAYVQMNVGDGDPGRFVERLKARIDERVRPRLPTGVSLEFSGRWEERERVRNRLRGIVPASLLIIFMLLLLLYRSAGAAAHVMLAIPFALTGGFLLQFILGTPFSVAVWVGYIALFGTAIQTAMVMVVYLEDAVKQKRDERGGAFNLEDLRAAVRAGALLRLRPKLMTAATVIASLLPLMFTNLPGAEVMRPLAVPIIGGMVSSLLHSLLVTPAIFSWLEERSLARVERS